jgi:hypothetical protein
MSANKTSENKRDYEVGRGKPPVHSRFKKGESGNPRGPRPKNLPAPLVDALNEKVVVTIDRERPRDHQARGGRHSDGQRIGPRQFARATKMLIDIRRPKPPRSPRRTRR